MKLLDLFTAVKEENLDKYRLESYHKELSELYSQMHLEMGQIKKKKGMYILNSTEPSAVAKKIQWDGSELGQREIELKSYIHATATQLKSLKSRLYSQY